MYKGQSFKTPLKLSELMKGAEFELSGMQEEEDIVLEEDDESNGNNWDDDIDVDAYKNPCETSFSEWKKSMKEISEGVHKKILKAASAEAKVVDLERQRIIYHRNFYVEGDNAPFDSTYLSGKPDEICLPIKKGIYLDGFLEALESMKEGEQSLFVVSYKKMFKELGCPPRIKPKADILCDICVIKTENVGSKEEIEKLMSKKDERDKFADLKQPVEELLSRANDSCSKSKFEHAITLYQRALQVISTSETVNNDEKVEKVKLMKRTLMNLAISCNRNERYTDTLMHISNLESIISIEKEPKALFAKGKALMKTGENESALKFLVKAQSLNPLNQQINDTIEELRQRKHKYDDFTSNFGKNLKLK